MSNEKMEKNKVLTEGIIAVDIFSRLFGLSDILNNLSNFGLGSENNNDFFFKVLDFRFPFTQGSYENQTIFKGWVEANGTFKYSDQLVKKVLRKGVEEKLYESREVFFKVWVIGAIGEIEKKLCLKLNITKDEKNDLESFSMASCNNFEKFSEDFEVYEKKISFNT